MSTKGFHKYQAYTKNYLEMISSVPHPLAAVAAMI